MKTYNTIYTNKKNLINFIELNKINVYNNILIQIYTAVHDIHTIKDLIGIINIQLPKSKIIGCSTIEPIFDAEGISKQCVISITVFEKTILNQKTYTNSDGNEYELGLMVAQETCSCDTKVAITLVPNFKFNIKSFIDGFNKIYPSVIMSGGIASKTVEDFAFDNYGVYKNGITIVTLTNAELYVHNYMINGIKPIGSEYEITEISGDIIKKIGPIEAQNWYKKYLGDEIFSSEYMAMSRFPLVVGDNPSLVRAVTYLENEGLKSIIKLNIGDKVRIGYGSIKVAISNCKSICNRIKNVPIESLFVFSCLARRDSMKECSSWELKPFKGNNILTGFFTFGEVANLDSKNYIFNNMCTFLGLSEYPNSRINLNFSAFDEISELDTEANRVLTALIHDTNDNLFEINKLLIEKVTQQTQNIKDKLLIDRFTGLDNLNKYNFDLTISNYTKIALFSITNFKFINSIYGSELTNKLMVELVNKFIEYANNYKLKAYSFYTEIFAVVGENNISNPTFVFYMKQLQRELNNNCFFVDTYEVCVNVNTVLVLEPSNLENKAMLTLEYLEETKENFLIYNEDLKLEERIENNFIWIKKIKAAINNDRIIPYFQPIYNNQTNSYDKYEALMRLIDEDDNIILPLCFLDIAKKYNLYKKLSKIMIDKTFEFFESKDFQFSINITVEDIIDYEIRNYILFKLKLFPKPQKVIFELVETENIEQYDEIKSFIEEIKSFGAKIAIDNFGAGYSNLMYLIQLNVDIIKIDGSIIKSLHYDSQSDLVASTVIYFASNLNIEIIAECVEDKNIFDMVKNMGIHYSQGYYFSKPQKSI